MIPTEHSADAVRQFAQRILATGYSDLPARERRVIERMAKRRAVSRDVTSDYESHLTFGERLSDRIASFGGSWTFIMLFGAAIAIWIGLNSSLLARDVTPLDPFPYILLNLMLSLVAAIQAPVIMMSQNRQAAKDRLQAAQDYEVNLKAELEILALHEKLDEIRTRELAALIARIGGEKPENLHNP